MHIQHDASVFVTDGRKALLLRNNGDAEFPDLRLEQKWEHDLAADRDLKSDAPGRAFSSHDGGTRRSAYEQSNWHETAETRFVSNLAQVLHERSVHHAIRELVIVAPPRMLGELRRHFDHSLRDVVIAEISKDLVKHPIADIGRLLSGHSEPGGVS